MVYKMFMSANNFVGHTDENEKEKDFQNKYVGQIDREKEKEMLLKGGTNKQGQEEPWAMFRSQAPTSSRVALSPSHWSRLCQLSALLHFSSLNPFLILNSHSGSVIVHFTDILNCIY